jgi:hypothetical protein
MTPFVITPTIGRYTQNGSGKDMPICQQTSGLSGNCSMQALVETKHLRVGIIGQVNKLLSDKDTRVRRPGIKRMFKSNPTTIFCNNTQHVKTSDDQM